MAVLKISDLVLKAESFYNIKNGSSIITSKSESKNLNNEKKLLVFLLSLRQNVNQNANWKHSVSH